MPDLLTIGQAASATGLSVHALRWFEAEGMLLREIPRTSSGRRLYAEEDIEWLLLCNRFRASGMPIEIIVRFAALVRQGPGNEQERLDLLRSHEDRVRTDIDVLRDHLEVISAKVRAYEQHLATGTASSLWDPRDAEPTR